MTNITITFEQFLYILRNLSIPKGISIKEYHLKINDDKIVFNHITIINYTEEHVSPEVIVNLHTTILKCNFFYDNSRNHLADNPTFSGINFRNGLTSDFEGMGQVNFMP